MKYLLRRARLRAALGLLLACLLLGLLSCGIVPYDEPAPPGTTYTVTLHTQNGESPTEVTVGAGKCLPRPKNPTKTGHLFDDWYTDETLTSPWDFSEPVTRDTDLYAGYFTDAAALVNRVSGEAVPAAVTVVTECSTGGPLAQSYLKTGSGVMFSREGSTYYLLTNNHVVCAKTGYSRYSYSVTDCFGNSYTATLLGADPDYDLALLSFETDAREFPTLPLAEENAPVGETVVAIGQPKGQDNTVTLGTVTAYRTVETYESEDSNIDFAVLWHDAPVASGSSGGALLDSSLRVVGITFGEGTLNGEFVSGFSVPIAEVWAFLEQYETILP